MFVSADSAVDALKRRHGNPRGIWYYLDAELRLVGLVLRFDGPEGKTYRPVSKFPDGWRIAAMEAPRPLYRLSELARAERVVVCEGEKATDAARSIGFVATTSAGGSQAPDKTDWTPLTGKEVWILPDADPPGRKYAETVAGILAQLDPPATVRIVELPGLPEAGDIVDWIEARRGTSKDALRAEIERLAEATPPWQPPAQQPQQPTAAAQAQPAKQSPQLPAQSHPAKALPERNDSAVAVASASSVAELNGLALTWKRERSGGKVAVLATHNGQLLASERVDVLSDAERGKLATEWAERLKVPLEALQDRLRGIAGEVLQADAQREQRRVGGGQDSGEQGQQLELPSPEPWPEPVELGDVLAEAAWRPSGGMSG